MSLGNLANVAINHVMKMSLVNHVKVKIADLTKNAGMQHKQMLTFLDVIFSVGALLKTALKAMAMSRNLHAHFMHGSEQCWLACEVMTMPRLKTLAEIIATMQGLIERDAKTPPVTSASLMMNDSHALISQLIPRDVKKFLEI